MLSEEAKYWDDNIKAMWTARPPAIGPRVANQSWEAVGTIGDGRGVEVEDE